MDQTNKEKYLNQFSFNNHEFNFLMLVNDEHECLRTLESFSEYMFISLSHHFWLTAEHLMFFILEAVEKQRGIVSLADDWESIILKLLHSIA